MQDVMRYVLTANAPETKDNDFTWKDFQAKNNNELVASLGNYINRVMVLTHKYFNGLVPDNVKPNDLDKEVFNKINVIKLNIETSINNYRFKEAMSLIIDLSRVGNKYLTDTEPWKIIKEDEDRVKSILYNSIQVIAHIAILCEPLLPFTSLKILKILNMKHKSWIDISDNLINSGHQLGETLYNFNLNTPIKDINAEALNIILYGTKDNIMELKETISKIKVFMKIKKLLLKLKKHQNQKN